VGAERRPRRFANAATENVSGDRPHELSTKELQLKRTPLLVLLAAAVLGLAGCGGGDGEGGAGGTTGTDTTLNGAGSSFVFPLVDQWKAHYDKATIEYNPIGSGGGIEAITDRTVDFGATDAPLSREQQTNCGDCVVVPWALSATSIAYNLEGAPPHLKITGPVLANIYLGRITHWNDRALARLNPGVQLPDAAIAPIWRSDSSGTTYNFTEYLSAVSPSFKEKVGNSTQVNFPVGTGGAKSSGVSAVLQRTNGGITYVDVAYALESGFSYFAVENAAGTFVVPTLASIAAAGKAARPDSLSVVNPKDAPGAYPISTYTYVILRKGSPKATALKDFVSWALTDGQQFGPKLLFAPLPAHIVESAQQTLKQVGT
jgi:phosphate transport system substrate-binding protein